MEAILQSIASSPALALLGAGVLLTIILIPLALRLAGLTGAQIVQTIQITLQAFIQLAQGFRAQNKDGKK